MLEGGSRIEHRRKMLSSLAARPFLLTLLACFMTSRSPTSVETV